MVKVVKKKVVKPESENVEKEVKVQIAQVAKNSIRVIQQTVINRELRWLYPEECLDTLSRKAFRQMARNSITGLEKKLFALQNNDELRAKYTAKNLKTQIQTLKEEALSKRKQYLADPTIPL